MLLDHSAALARLKRWSSPRRMRVCLNCATDDPVRFGFWDWREDRFYPDAIPESDYFWSATEPGCVKSPEVVLARRRGALVAAELAGDDAMAEKFFTPTYKEFK